LPFSVFVSNPQIGMKKKKKQPLTRPLLFMHNNLPYQADSMFLLSVSSFLSPFPTAALQSLLCVQ